MAITPLTNTDTFQTWFNTTNTVISAINGITVYNILPGDGISLTNNNGVFTIKHGSSVATPVTFTGPVSFTNTVSFNTAPNINTVTVAVSPKITGITIGNVVRITDTGLTLSRANSAENSEVLGIVVGSDASSHTVATSGVVNNTTFTNTISNLLGVAGGTLSVGCAYFLRPDVAGGITTVEPTIYGQVSKPILLGITGSAGAILPYRGILIEGISAGITAELDNKIIVRIDYSSGNWNSPTGNVGYFFPLNKGDLIGYAGAVPDNSWIATILQNVGSIKLLGGILGDSTFNNIPNIYVPMYPESYISANPTNILGVVTNILSDVGSVLTVELLTRGGSFNVKKSELDSNYYDFTDDNSVLRKGGIFKFNINAGKFKIVSNTTNTTSFARIIPLNDAEETLKFIFDGTEYLTAEGSISRLVPSGNPANLSGITGDIEYDNLVPNGSFTIWQRGYTPLTGVTLAGLCGSNTPICDRWFYMTDPAATGNLTGLTLNVERGNFDSDQIVVPGSPRYWIDLNQKYSSTTGLNYRPRFENLQIGARLIQGQQATISFWAMAGVCGSTMDLVYNQYAGTYNTTNDASDALASRNTIASGVELSTTWNKYSYTFTGLPQVIGLETDQEGWYGIGFEFPSSGVTLSIAQVRLELGDTTMEPVYIYPQKELERCSPYYLRTYDWNQPSGYAGTSKLNEETVTLGNLQSQDVYDVKFPVEMVQSPTVTLYSPTGQINEAYNVTKKADMRYPRCEGCPIHVNLPWDTTTVRTSLPSGNITVPNTSVNGMQVKINNGATHLDTLKFHYVADADIKLTV